jgi:hypothetical protein
MQGITHLFLCRLVDEKCCCNFVHVSCIRGCIQKFPKWIDNEIYDYNNKHSFRSNTKGYGGKTHETDSQNSDTTASNGRELHHLQFSVQEASSETFGNRSDCCRINLPY